MFRFERLTVWQKASRSFELVDTLVEGFFLAECASDLRIKCTERHYPFPRISLRDPDEKRCRDASLLYDRQGVDLRTCESQHRLSQRKLFSDDQYAMCTGVRRSGQDADRTEEEPGSAASAYNSRH